MKADIILKKELLKGNDGGYYVPSMDSEYNLSFTPSNDKMPTVEPYNLKQTMTEGFFETDDYKNMTEAEINRQEAEQERQAKEVERATAEQSRQLFETERIEAEQARQEAEDLRIIVNDSLVAEAEEAIEATKSATKSVNDAITALTGVAHANAIKPEEKNSLIYITDGAEAPTDKVVSYITPKQEGTGEPSPENIRPVSGWETINAIVRCGKNLFDAERAGKIENWDMSGTSYIGIDLMLPPGNYRMSYVPAVSSLDNNICVVCKEPRTANNAIGIVVSGSYAVSSGGIQINLKEGEKAYINWYASNSAGGRTQAGLDVLMSSVLVNTQIEMGNVKTEYEPYKGDTYTAELNELVYGGSYDWNTGTLEKTERKLVLNGSETWTANLDNNGQYHTFPFVIVSPDNLCAGFNDKQKCSHFYVSRDGAYNRQKEDSIFVGQTGNSTVIWVYAPRFGTATDLKNYIKEQYENGTPITVVYTLKEPTTIEGLDTQVIQTHYGTNSIYSNSGETEIKYTADTKLYIDKKFNELSTALVAMGGN